LVSSASRVSSVEESLETENGFDFFCLSGTRGGKGFAWRKMPSKYIYIYIIPQNEPQIKLLTHIPCLKLIYLHSILNIYLWMIQITKTFKFATNVHDFFNKNVLNSEKWMHALCNFPSSVWYYSIELKIQNRKRFFFKQRNIGGNRKQFIVVCNDLI
jgi:hypothetical protein